MLRRRKTRSCTARGSLLAGLPAGAVAAARRPAPPAYTDTPPGKTLLVLGDEFGQGPEQADDTALEGDLRGSRLSGISRWHRSRTARTGPTALSRRDFDRLGFSRWDTDLSVASDGRPAREEW